MALLALLTVLMTRDLRGWRAATATILLMFGVAVLAIQLMARQGTWLYLFSCELGIVMSWGLTEASESRRAARLLSQFVPSFLHKAEVRRPGEIRSLEATLLYSDIRGFTTTAEQLSSTDTLGMLNVFHSAMEDLIAKHGGSIVKVPGDAILAVFWRDRRSANHATCALRAAREMLANLPALARAWEAAGVRLEIGIGLNSGSVAMALVGKHHLEPTVIGDAVKRLGAPGEPDQRGGVPAGLERGDPRPAAGGVGCQIPGRIRGQGATGTGEVLRHRRADRLSGGVGPQEPVLLHCLPLRQATEAGRRDRPAGPRERSGGAATRRVPGTSGSTGRRRCTCRRSSRRCRSSRPCYGRPGGTRRRRRSCPEELPAPTARP